MENKEEEKNVVEKVKQQVEEQINTILNSNVQPGNVDYLYKLVDIHKDIENEEFWKGEKEMRYGRSYGYGDGEYGEGSYGRRGVPGTGRGRYRTARGGNYRGEEALNEMNYHYGNYHDSYNTGNYGAKEDSAYKMTEAFKEFGFSIAEELEPNEKMMFKQAMQEIMQELEH